MYVIILMIRTQLFSVLYPAKFLDTSAKYRSFHSSENPYLSKSF